MFRYLPEQASSHAHKVDWIHNVITDLSILFTVLIVGAMLYFAWKYRKKNGKDHETPDIHGDNRLEVIWTVVPTIICVFIGYYGIIYYHEIRTVPADAMTINVVGQKWWWDFEYENGKKTTGEFVVPVGKPVRLLMESKDILHSFFIPAMRVKSDVVPGQFTYISFTPIKTGVYQTFCTEYCGDNHWNMLAKLKVVSENEYETWLNDRSAEIKASKLDPSQLGAELYVSKGCNSCHSLDGSARVGPSFLKVFGSEKELVDGSKVLADEEYLRTSILEPNLQIVKGYNANMMPVFEGQLQDNELKGLIAFIKSLDGSKKIEVETVETESEDLSALSPEQRGEKLFQSNACAACHSLDGSRLVGPSLKGLYGRSGELADGSKYTADDAYIKESILQPTAKVVKDYPPAMPPANLNDEQIADVISYLKTIK